MFAFINLFGRIKLATKLLLEPLLLLRLNLISIFYIFNIFSCSLCFNFVVKKSNFNQFFEHFFSDDNYIFFRQQHDKINWSFLYTWDSFVALISSCFALSGPLPCSVLACLNYSWYLVQSSAKWFVEVPQESATP